MKGPKYWRLALRLPAYQGATAAALERDREESEDQPVSRPPRRQTGASPNKPEYLNPATVDMNPTTRGLFET